MPATSDEAVIVRNQGTIFLSAGHRWCGHLHALRILHSASPRWAPRAAAVGGAPTEEAAVNPA